MNPEGTFLPCFSYSLACAQRIFQSFSHSFCSGRPAMRRTAVRFWPKSAKIASSDTSRASSGLNDALLLALAAMAIAAATQPRAANRWRSAAVQTALIVEEAELAVTDQLSAGAASIRWTPRRLVLRPGILAASASGGSPKPLDNATASAVSNASSLTKSDSPRRCWRALPRGGDAERSSEELSLDLPVGSPRLQPALLSPAAAAPLGGRSGVP